MRTEPGNRPGSGARESSRKASRTPRTPPAEAAGRIARTAAGKLPNEAPPLSCEDRGERPDRARPRRRPARAGPPGARAALRRARLGLPARRRGPDRRRRAGHARCTATTACATAADADEASLRRAVRAARRPAPRPPAGARRGQPAGVGARRALRRGARARARGDIAAGHTASDQVETSSTGSRPRPAGARCSGCARATGGSSGRCSASRARRPRPTARARGLDWREDASNADPAFARGRVRHALLPALRAIHPAAEANVLRTLALLRDEAEVLDAVVGAALAAAGDPPRADALRALPPALQRLARPAARRATAPAIGHRTRRDPRAGRGRRAGRRRRPARGDPRRRAAVRREHGTRGAAAS